MHVLRTATLTLATTASIVLSGGAAVADTASGTWPAEYPLPLDPGTLIAQSSETAVVRSTDVVIDVKAKLDALYVDQLGCTRVAAVNKPRDYFCFNAATGTTDEVYFTFAALEFTADGSKSQTNAFFVQG
jgi:outer membrane protein assembly factor BamB